AAASSPRFAAGHYNPSPMWDSEQLLRAVVAAGVLAVFISAIAYTYQPRLKLFVFSMPVPFVSGYLFTQIPVGTIHLIGIALTVVYHWIVYLLRRRLGVPLLVGIAVGIGAYIALAAMAQLLSDLPFKWAATGFV